MTGASITGWGSCMPPAVLSNDDLATFLDTSDEWIVTRTGMRERRISHVSATHLATLAARRALACAGLEETALEMVNRIRAHQDPHGRSREGLLAPVFPEEQGREQAWSGH